MKNINKKTIYWISSIILVIVLVIIIFPSDNSMSIEEKREKFISIRDSIIQDLIQEGGYRCCLENPCDSCIALTPWHGEGARCDCLEDLVNEEYPCGECVGGILAGRGNPYLKEYFVKSIAEGIGEEYIPNLEKIIEEKYG